LGGGWGRGRNRAPYLSQIESGKREGTAEVLAAIAKALGLSLDEIVMSS